MDACVKLYSESSLWLKHKSKQAENGLPTHISSIQQIQQKIRA